MTTKRELQKQGFRPVPGFDALYINRAGTVYDYRRKRILSPRPKNRVAYADKQISVPRLLLLAYRKQPYNTRRQIRYIDGDKTNIEVDNLSYTPDPATLWIDYADLYMAVRCYFQVPKRYKATDRAGTLQMLDYQPRKKTTAQAIKEYNETVRKPKGLEPIKIPRKKSTAQLLKDWSDRIEALKNECKNTGDSL